MGFVSRRWVGGARRSDSHSRRAQIPTLAEGIDQLVGTLDTRGSTTER